MKKIIHNVGLFNNLPDRVVNDIITSAFEMVKSVIEGGDRENAEYENIQLLNFGKFYASEGVKQKLREINKKRKNESI